MPEAIISASGTQYGLVVNPDGSINIGGTVAVSSITGSIMIGSVSAQVDSVYIQSGNQVQVYGSGLFTGSIISMPTVNVAVGSETWIKGGSISIYNQIAGSIVYMPAITTGSNVYIKGGSITTYGVGSVYTVNSVSTGSEQWIKGGSIEVYNRVAGSVVNMPSLVGSFYVTNQISEITVGSEQWIKNFNELGSSVVVTNLYTGSKSYQGDRYGVSGIVEVSNMVAGSIVYMPTVNVTTGSNSYIKGGSIEVYTGSIHVTNFSAGTGYAGSENWIKNFGDLGSSVVVTNLYAGSKVWQGERFGVSGIVNITTRVAGSIVNMPIVAVSGTLFSNIIGSVRAQAVQITDPWQIAGSIWSMPDVSVSTGSEVWIQNPVGISGTNDIGSVVIKSAPLLGVSGAIFTNGNIVGSVVIKSAPLLGVSGLIFTDGNMTGSMAMKGIGSMIIASSVRLGGSIVNLPGDLGSVVISSAPLLGVSGAIFTGGDIVGSVVISSAPLLGVSGEIFTGGDITGSVVISSAPRLGVSGIVEIASGSIFISNNIQEVGSPCFKRGILTGSAQYTNVWPIGGAGSRVEIHGWHLSSDNPGYVRILRSGGTPVVISDWNLNYASGAVIEKTFVNPITPAAADIPIGIGATVTGSVLCTIFGREVK